MIAIASLVDRSGEPKRELLEFSWQPRFDRDRRQVLPEDERGLLLGWRNVVEGIFEVQDRDEVEGMGLYADFGLIEEAFADPSLLRHPDYRRRVRDNPDDDSVSPLLFVRIAARDPERTNEVFRKLLGRSHFDWTIDGEKLMRRRKPDYFEQPRLPRIVALSDKLAPYAASA